MRSRPFRTIEGWRELSGRRVEEMPPEFREWFIPFGDGGYVSLYRYDGQTVAILAIRHGREAGYGN
jgi:plasmid stabilization system protein ParE